MTFAGSPPAAAGLVKKARESGASLAGIASVARLMHSPSYEAYERAPYYETVSGPLWPPKARSVLVLALAHGTTQPQLDWWDGQSGGTKGNRALIRIASSLALWIKEGLAMEADPLSYYVHKGGVLLKDAAVLAGLGVIGRNNLLITPDYGPRVRLCALFLDGELEPTDPAISDPCIGCDRPCWGACPQGAFKAGSYRRDRCAVQMKLDAANRALVEGCDRDEAPDGVVKYCRACELACPVGTMA